MECRFCKVEESKQIDFYQCDECQSIMCYNCMYTSTRTGRDYCEYCRRNLLYVGKVL